MNAIVNVRYSSLTPEFGTQNNNEINNLRLTEHVKRMMHDVASPLALLSMLKESSNLVSTEKDLVEHVIDRFHKIMESFKLQMNCANDTQQTISGSEICHSIQQIIAEKEIEYANSKVEFTYSGSCEKRLYLSGYIGDFERMLSNLLNNAVDACVGRSGIIDVKLKVKDNKICLDITDNGKGIPDEVLKKIYGGISVTHGKEHGNGIGFVQITDAIKRLNGIFDIISMEDYGTKIHIVFKPTK